MNRYLPIDSIAMQAFAALPRQCGRRRQILSKSLNKQHLFHMCPVVAKASLVQAIRWKAGLKASVADRRNFKKLLILSGKNRLFAGLIFHQALLSSSVGQWIVKRHFR
jgi:hypothetical protein